MEERKVGVEHSTRGIPITKIDNFYVTRNKLCEQLKYIIGTEMIFGISRYHLYRPQVALIFLNYVYCVGLTSVVVYFEIIANVKSQSLYLNAENALCVEFILLSFNAAFVSKHKFKVLFEILDNFDTELNIKPERCFIRKSVVRIILCLFYGLLEPLLLLIHEKSDFSITEILLQFALIAHDSESVFFSLMLKIIKRRVAILRNHVTKLCSTSTKDGREGTEIEIRDTLDVSTAHKMYELLHNCSELLNSIMNFPLTLIVLTAGLSTTLLLNKLILNIQTDTTDLHTLGSTMIRVIFKIFKFAVLMILPCYYSYDTSNDVSAIRTVLNDKIASLSVSQDNVYQRKLKAFLHLTREYRFEYSLWGVIRLDMTLLISYCSLCATYLVIILQFSKFMD